MKVQKIISNGLGSFALLAMLMFASGPPSVFAQTTGSTTDMTASSTTATTTSSTATSTSSGSSTSSTTPSFCMTATSTEGFFVTTDMLNYQPGQTINFCLDDNTRTPLFLDGTHPWEITNQNGNVVFTPNPGTLSTTTNPQGTSFFTDTWNGMNASSTNVTPGIFKVVFPGFPGTPFATFSIMNTGSTSTSSTGTSSTSSSTTSTSTSTTGTGSGTGTTTGTGSTGSTTTSTSTGSVDLNSLLNQLENIETTIANLIHQIQSALGTSGGTGTGITTGTTGTSANGSAMIDQNGHTFTAGSSIDFGGHGFFHEENVSVALNGTIVGSAHADGGGNFSTGSMSLPSTPGTYTYTFHGQNGDMAQATIVLH